MVKHKAFPHCVSKCVPSGSEIIVTLQSNIRISHTVRPYMCPHINNKHMTSHHCVFKCEPTIETTLTLGAGFLGADMLLS